MSAVEGLTEVGFFSKLLPLRISVTEAPKEAKNDTCLFSCESSREQNLLNHSAVFRSIPVSGQQGQCWHVV